MNKNNMEDLRAEMKALKVPQEMMADAEQQMEKGIPKIEIKGQLPADKGTMDITLHFKKSEQSEYYYLNKYDLALSKAKPLEQGKNFMVISTGGDGKKQFKNFKSPVEAIANFKKREGDAELGIGKNITDYQSVATLKNGKVDYVSKEFGVSFYDTALTQTYYVKKGAGFSVKQGANMLQKRSVYRDDLVSRGTQYKAYNILLMDEPKDKYGNFKIRQFSDPSYGFNLQKELAAYPIKELDDPKKLEQLLSDLKDGYRPVVTLAMENGEEKKLRVEAAPRYFNMNFFSLSGKPEKREELQKTAKLEQGLKQQKNKTNTKEMAEGISIQ
jgi:hypothetical protein